MGQIPNLVAISNVVFFKSEIKVLITCPNLVSYVLWVIGNCHGQCVLNILSSGFATDLDIILFHDKLL